MKTEMSKTPNPKNECSECGKAIFNEGGKCVTCLVADTKEEETKVWITIPTKPENPNKKKINIKKRKINAENKEENLKIKSTINTNMMKKHKLYYTEKVNVNRAKKTKLIRTEKNILRKKKKHILKMLRITVN